MFRSYEQELKAKGYRRIAGVDEAGRGPLAGPVVAAACILPEVLEIEGIDDSKKLTPIQRAALFEALTHHPNVSFAVAAVEADVIDQINILQATFQAMLLAVSRLTQPPDYLLIDGPLLPASGLPMQGIVKGDSLCQSIAAASILAKVTRDQMMMEHDGKWPDYGFKKHKGYPTAAHLKALAFYGPCPIHRLTYKRLKSILGRHDP